MNENYLITKNVPHIAVVILAHSEYVQFHIVMIDTVHLGTQLPCVRHEDGAGILLRNCGAYRHGVKTG